MCMVTLHVSVWVEMAFATELNGFSLSRSTWACELKCAIASAVPSIASSRSTWACELKCQSEYLSACQHVTLHVSVWVEIERSRSASGSRAVTLHVSVWVEILCWRYVFVVYPSHAPHERVGQFSFQRRTYRYWIIQITAWLRFGGIFIPKYYTIFMCFPSNPPIHTPKFVQTNDL